jgi:TolB-like protein
VLAFADLSPQQDQEYLGDGIAEEILNSLAMRLCDRAVAA